MLAIFKQTLELNKSKTAAICNTDSIIKENNIHSFHIL